MKGLFIKMTSEKTNETNQDQVNTASKDDDHKRKLLEEFARRFEISPQWLNQINVLEKFDVVVLCDDSGSMRTSIQGTTNTRWDELRQMLDIIIDIYAVLDSNGVDIYFLK